MRTWTYSYKTSDGLRHESEMAAPSKDDVYAALRERGIRAIKVTERIQPVVRKGFSGLRRRDWAFVGLALVATAVGVFVALHMRGGLRKDSTERDNSVVTSGLVRFAQPHPRKWIELPASINFSKVFRFPHEAYLANFARPGDSAGVDLDISPELAQDFYDNLNVRIVVAEDDSPEIAELKKIVAGLKDDAKKYLGVPNGLAQMAGVLSTRQKLEAEYRARIAADVERGRGKAGYNASVESANRILELGGLMKIGQKSTIEKNEKK